MIEALDRCSACYSTQKLKHIHLFAAETQFSLSKRAKKLFNFLISTLSSVIVEIQKHQLQIIPRVTVLM